MPAPPKARRTGGRRTGCRSGPVGDQIHRAARADGAELARVAHQHEAGAGRVDNRADPVELDGADHRGLVDENDVPGPDGAGEVDLQRPAGLEPLVRGEPRGDVRAAGDAVLAQDLGCVLGDGEPVDPATSKLLPGVGERARSVRLPGAGGTY